MTLLLWSSLKEPLPEPVASVAVPTSQELMLQIQNKLEADPNDAKLWFQLGQGYMNDYDFKSAATSFDYSLRLTLNPSANQYAALASALYYSKSQILSDDIQDLLDHALAQDSHNINALMLIASDHYVSFRYQKAIDSWQKILDSNKQEVDRARVINSINQAKGYL